MSHADWWFAVDVVKAAGIWALVWICWKYHVRPFSEY